MDDSPPERGPLTPGARWECLLFLLLLVGLLAAEIIRDYQPVKLTALFFFLFWIPLLALHEAGHAVVAALLGWRVGQVVIGMGPEMARFHVGGVPVILRMIPAEGFVMTVPRTMHRIRLKNALISFAGAGVELLLLGVLVLFLGFETLVSKTEAIGLLAVQSLALAILVSSFITLVPHAIAQPPNVGSGSMASDGLHILRSFWMPDDYFARQIGKTFPEPEDDRAAYDPADEWDR